MKDNDLDETEDIIIKQNEYIKILETLIERQRVLINLQKKEIKGQEDELNFYRRYKNGNKTARI